MENEEKNDENIITAEDLASAVDGNFINKIKEFAWRGKEAKLPHLPTAEMDSFYVKLELLFGADPESLEPLTLANCRQYQFHCSPITADDVRMSKENAEKNS